MYDWCRTPTSRGGPACSCNQNTGVPECGMDSKKAGDSFDFENMLAAYPCLNCLCQHGSDKRRFQFPPAKPVLWQMRPLGTAHGPGITHTQGGPQGADAIHKVQFTQAGNSDHATGYNQVTTGFKATKMRLATPETRTATGIGGVIRAVTIPNRPRDRWG